jgi:hypothetical protein
MTVIRNEFEDGSHNQRNNETNMKPIKSYILDPQS